jgi:hypothetical protein
LSGIDPHRHSRVTRTDGLVEFHGLFHGASNARLHARALWSRVMEQVALKRQPAGLLRNWRQGGDEMKDMMISTVMRAYAVGRHHSWERSLSLWEQHSSVVAPLSSSTGVQRVMILYLQSMSDRELKEIGLPRSQIELTVGRAVA